MQLCWIPLLMFVALNSSHAAILNTNPVNGSTLYKCTGSDVIVPFSYSLPPGDAVVKIQLYFNDRLAATYLNMNKQLLAHQEFMGRFELAINENKTTTQLTIKNVTKKDTGDYIIKVNGRSRSHSTFTLTLEVTDNHQLHLTQNSFLVLNKTKNSWSVELLCGIFPYKQTPPFDVQWLTPSRQAKASTGYQDGFFYQHLPYPLEGGEYTCRLPKQTPDACLSGDVEATLLVDPGDARMSLIEAILASFQEQNQVMNQQLQDQLKNTNQLINDQTNNMNQQLKNLTKNMNQQIQDQTKNMNQQIQDLTKNMNQQVQDQMKKLNQDLTRIGSLESGKQELIKNITEEDIRIGYAQRCSSSKDYALVNGVCLKVHLKSRLTFGEGKDICRTEKAHLYDMKSFRFHMETLRKAFTIIGDGKNYQYWIGLNDKQTESDFRWSDGSRLTDSSVWRKGEPNDHGGKEDCALLNINDGLLNDVDCWVWNRFICQLTL